MKNKIWLALNLIVLTAVASFVFIEKSAAKDEENWEYKVVANAKENDLNYWGANGWELVAVETTNSEGTWYGNVHYLKRRKR